MFPILYEQITPGVVPQHNGLGVLSDCSSCECENKRNGSYELVFEYPMNGIHAQDIALRRVVKVKPNPTDNPQLFRIKRISKVMNGYFTVYCRHIGYDLSGCEITSGTAASAAAACQVLQNAASGYTITTDKTLAADFVIDTPASVRSYFAGKAGSFLDVYGPAEIKYDNFSVQFLTHAGTDRGVELRYAKNLLELSQEIDAENLYTHVLCFYKDDDVTIIGDKVSTGLVLDVPNTLVVDCSDQFDEIPTIAMLTTKATNYIASHNLTTPTNNITLDFVQSGELTNRVDLCDTVSIFYEALGITRANVKCIRTKYDCIREKYIETEFGDVKDDFTDSFVAASKEIADKPSASVMETAIKKATELITGNLGGYVVMHDTDNDGEPNEILIMNTDDIQTATKVWRWNENGLGYSSTGYSGTYSLAITANGEIVADFIKTGTLNANLIKAGVISDADGNSEIDMETGVAKLYELNAIKAFNLLTQGDEDVRSTFNALQFATEFVLSPDDAENDPFIRLKCFKRQNQNSYSELLMNNDGTTNTVLIEANNIGGSLTLKNENGVTAIQFFANSIYGGNWYLNNTNGDHRFHAFVGSVNDDGILDVFDANGNTTINLVGHEGKIDCGTVRPSRSQWEEIYSGSLTTGYFTTDYDQFNTFLVMAKVTNTSSFNELTIPKAMLTDQDQRFCISDEVNYITFNVRVVFDDPVDGNYVVFTFYSRNSTGSIQKVYGSYT